MRRAARVDDNHPAIVAALRKIGATVQSLASIGQGCPDILVAFRDVLYLMEIKDGNKIPSKRKLTKDEQEWIKQWASDVYVVETVEQAIGVVTGDESILANLMYARQLIGVIDEK